MKSVSVSCSFLLSFLLLTFHFHLIHAFDDEIICNPDDQNVLLLFKSTMTSDDRGIYSNWQPGTNGCNWHGIFCDFDGRVTQIEVSNAVLSGRDGLSALSKLPLLEHFVIQNIRNISGPFPDFLYNMPNLRVIGIQYCNLSGPLSPKIGSLTNLYYINLQGNNLSGSLPDNFASLTNLDTLVLTNNRFSGKIPNSLNMTSLTFIHLGNNFLRGAIPDGFRNFKSLFFCWLDHNLLSGTIPDFFSSFPIVASINLSFNKLHGQIPSSLSLASSLIYLNLGHNSLNGTIPSSIGDFGRLAYLYLGWNNFSGVIPTSFSKLTTLQDLDLSHNSLTDPVPVLNLNGIQSLDLSNNLFHLGEIPMWISNVSSTVKLAKCGIKMKLDDWHPKDPTLYKYIDISNNEISGSPVTLLSQANTLVHFKASGNQLKFDIGTLMVSKTVEDLDLSRNLIYGKVPTSVAQVKKLNLNHNGNICGSPYPPCKV